LKIFRREIPQLHEALNLFSEDQLKCLEVQETGALSVVNYVNKWVKGELALTDVVPLTVRIGFSTFLLLSPSCLEGTFPESMRSEFCNV